MCKTLLKIVPNSSFLYIEHLCSRQCKKMSRMLYGVIYIEFQKMTLLLASKNCVLKCIQCTYLRVEAAVWSSISSLNSHQQPLCVRLGSTNNSIRVAHLPRYNRLCTTKSTTSLCSGARNYAMEAVSSPLRKFG